LSKSILDFFTAMVFACNLGAVTSLVAVPQAVTMLAAPGPTEEVATQICLRFICLAKATAAWAMPCSFLP